MTVNTVVGPPSRFRQGEERGARLGKVLKTVGRVKTVDEDQMALIGTRFMARDEIGAALARAMRSSGDDKVTMAQFNQALAHGVGSVEAPPPALCDFFATVEQVPDWVDFDLINEGAGVYRRSGKTGADVLLQLSLIGGYRFGGPTDLLVATGGLAGDMTLRHRGSSRSRGTGHDRCPGVDLHVDHLQR